jgi:hypothetical protein
MAREIKMGAQFKALQMQKQHPTRGTAVAAKYLKHKGYPLKAAMYILTGRVLP